MAMTVDYDRLREWLETVDRANANADGAIKFAYPGNTVEIIRELLRLRGEVEATRDRVARELERTPTELQAARITLHTEREHTLAFCDHLLNGDNE